MTATPNSRVIPIRPESAQRAGSRPPAPRSGPVTVGLVQINNSFSGQNYLPYSIACLEGYVRDKAADPSRYAFLQQIYKRMPVREAVEHLLPADVVGFSTYVWNARISLEIARRLKARKPEVLIVFGGPQVPDKPESFLREHPFIDVAAHNEGEQTFLQLLEAFPQRDWQGQTGISYIDGAGAFHRAPPTPRFRELEEVPSAFLNGIFDGLMAANPGETWIGLWETNRGCPFQCTFCDWGSATAAKVTKFEMDRLKRELDWFSRNKIQYIFVCDANFGIQKRDVEIAEHVASVRRATGFPQGFSVQNTKNATERAYLTQKILSDAGLNKGVALSMQSLDPLTLKNIKRDNISLETYLELARRFSQDKVETYSDLILALPGETYDSFCNGVNTLIEAGQHNRIQFNNLSILPNAEMGDPEYLARFGMKIVRSKIINIHGTTEEIEDDVQEMQDLVVATDSMPAEDWRRTRTFCWMTAFLHFDKLLQMPLIVTHEATGVSYRALIEAFLLADHDRYPVIAGVRDFFLKEAESIQNGGPEYVYSKAWLGIYWPADEYAFISLTVEGKLGAFHAEAQRLLEEFLSGEDARLPEGLIQDAVQLNHALVSQPFLPDDIQVKTRYNVLAFCDAVRAGVDERLVPMPSTIEVRRSAAHYKELEDWCRQVVWWGNKKGAYLYGNRTLRIEPELAGHY
jgi:radical SAM superfamily enzyme YgiQ (UPF0313 family)